MKPDLQSWQGPRSQELELLLRLTLLNGERRVKENQKERKSLRKWSGPGQG